MNNLLSLNFKKGLKDGLPIAFGYLSVSFAFGILAVNSGLPIWAPIITSLSNFTGTGQFVGTSMIAVGTAVLEIAFTQLIVNARYILMSISLSQRLGKMNFLKKMFIAFGNTDEIFAVAISKYTELNFRYMSGLILSSFAGWVGGTIIGAVAGAIVPNSILHAMGIALYAMFIAIIVPDMRKSRAVACVVAIGAFISVIFHYTPYLNKLNDSWIIIIAGIGATMIGAIAFPLKDEPKEPPPYVGDDKNISGNIDEKNFSHDNNNVLKESAVTKFDELNDDVIESKVGCDNESDNNNASDKLKESV